MADAIAMRGLTKDFGEGRGILDLDLRVPQGQVVGFLGPNGAGKTTTLRLLMGFLRPDRGNTEILGRPLDTDRAELHRHVGYIPGELALPQAERAQDYLDRCARLQGVDDLGLQRGLIEGLGLPADRRIRELSKGNRQKVVLVQALQHRPSLLILDEPTDGLDPVLRSRVGDLLREHARGGGTVFLSSHVVHEVQHVCDQVAVVIDGRLRHQARVSDLMQALPIRLWVDVPEEARRAVYAALDAHGALMQDPGDGRLRVQAAGDPLPLLAALHAAGASNASFETLDLEDTFMRLYEDAAPDAEAP